MIHSTKPAPRGAARSLAILLFTMWITTPALGRSLVDQLLRNENYKVRLKAATKLGRSGDLAALRHLVVGTGDPHPLVRAACADALGRLGDDGGLSALCALRRDRDDFVRRTARRALEALGGASRCAAKRLFLAVEVSGGDEALRRFVQDRVLRRAAKDKRVVLGRQVDFTGGGGGPDPARLARAGKMAGVEVKLRLQTRVQQGGGVVQIHCQVAQSVYDLKPRALRGSATQRAAIELGVASITPQAAAREQRGCVEALIPVLYEQLSSYLDRVR